MQEFILILSRCLSFRQTHKSKKSFYRFHFKGFYAGEKITAIHLYPTFYTQGIASDSRDPILTKGEDYLLWVKHKNINKGVLEVELIASKKIS